MTVLRLSRVLLVMAVWLVAPILARAQQGGNIARIVVWQMKPGMTRDFQEGYKRHLEWHRSNNDSWTWRGWTLGSGTRVDYFVDGTFFHSWSDFDSPVSPAGDGANNEINVEPYAEVRSLATYEFVPLLSNLQPQQMNSTLLTFCYLEVPPGRGGEFESLLSESLRDAQNDTTHGVFRPMNGTSEYLILLTAAKASEIANQSAFLRGLLQELASKAKGSNLVTRYRTETGRYHPELSYIPSARQ